MIRDTPQRTRPWRILTLLAVTGIFVVTAAGAIAQEIDFQIIGFGEKDCFNGTDHLSTGSAEPFDVEACVTSSGTPVSGVPIVAAIEHGDGSTEAIDLTTGPDGSVVFVVTPRAAGVTTVRMCLGSLDGNCDFGEVTLEADSPPRPPAVATYLGTTTDMGPSEPMIDGEDDFDDPYTGGPAELGAGDNRMDLLAFRYLGNSDGPAMFEAMTLGDTCELYEDEDTPWWQFTFFVSTMDDAHYNVTYRMNQGEEYANAYSSGVRLESDVSIYDCTGNTVVLAATGLDVPPGSQMQVLSWYSDDPVSSGLQDFADGFPVAAVVEEQPVETPAATETDSGETAITEGADDTTSGTVEASPISIDPDEGSSSFPAAVLLLIALFGIGGLFLWYRSRTRIASAVTAGADYATPESASTDLTAQDLEQYAKYGIEEHTAAATADALASEKADDLGRADAHAAETAALIAAAGTPELEPLPIKPDLSNIQLTDNPLLAFGFEFVTVMEEDLTTGRSRDRLAEVIVAMPDAFYDVGESSLDSFVIAGNGWSEIFSNPEMLGQLDESVVYAGEQFVEFAEDYGDAAEADDDRFVQMTAQIIASAEIGALTDRGLGVGKAAIIGRFKGTPSAPRTPGSTTQGPDAPAPTRPTPPVAPPHDPVGPIPPPTTSAPSAPHVNQRPIGYGPDVRHGVPERGGGTPIQKAPNGCGPAVARGIFNDLGLEVPTEISFLARGAQLFEDWNPNQRLWNPKGGTTGPGMGKLLDDMLPDEVAVDFTDIRSMPDKGAAVGKWMLDNPNGEVMAALRWRGAGAGGSGHWVRVESVKNGWVHIGDPSTPHALGTAIPTDVFQHLTESVITVTP